MNANRQTEDELRGLVEGYIAAVRDGSRVAGKLERLVVDRHVRDLERVDSGLRFDESRALHVLRFFVDYVRHTKGSDFAGKPYRFTEQSAWIAFVCWCVFGWVVTDDDGVERRRFRTAYICVARKNGKTMIAAILALYMLAFDGEAGAEVYFAATKRDQAKIGWRQAAQIVRKSKDKEFRRLFKITDYTAHISLPGEDAYAVALGRDGDSHDGLNPHLANVDELHEHKDREQWDVLDSGMGARRQGLMLGITTAGSKRSGLCWDLDHDAERTLTQAIEDDSTFSFIARLDEADDWRDESVWCKANPNLGESVRVESIRDACTKAQNNVAYLGEFKRKRCNLWAESEKAWLPVAKWDACTGEVDLAALEGRHCYVGIDISAVHDYTAAIAAFPQDDGNVVVVPRLWIPEATLVEREKIDKVPVTAWVEQGWVQTTPGEVIDQDAVKMWLLNLRERYDVRQVPIDQAQAWKLMSELEDLEFDVVRHGQGIMAMTGPVKETERHILRGARGETPCLIHDGNPCMRWMIANTCAKRDAHDNIKLDKEQSSDRIDGVVALVMALGSAVLVEESAGVGISVWGEEDTA